MGKYFDKRHWPYSTAKCLEVKHKRSLTSLPSMWLILYFHANECVLLWTLFLLLLPFMCVLLASFLFLFSFHSFTHIMASLPAFPSLLQTQYRVNLRLQSRLNPCHFSSCLVRLHIVELCVGWRHIPPLLFHLSFSHFSSHFFTLLQSIPYSIPFQSISLRS